MLVPYLSRLLILVSLSLLNTHGALCNESNNNDAVERPAITFPNIFDVYRRQVKIVSESISSTSGYVAFEEYIDLDSGKAASVARDGTITRVLYQSASENFSADYRPYTCSVESPPIIENWVDPEDPLFLFSFILPERSESGEQVDKRVKLRLGGVAGLWLLANSRNKSVEYSQMVYGHLDDPSEMAIIWKTKIANSGDHELEEIRLYFPKPESRLSMEMHPGMLEKITIVDRKGEVRRTINVISIDYHIDERERQEFLDLPVGYGCLDDGIDLNEISRADISRSRTIAQQQIELNTIFFQPGQFAMEIVATYFSQDGGKVHVSDTVQVDIDRHLVQPIRSIQIRDSDQDTKTVYDRVQQVAYQIDLMEGRCDLSHLSVDSKLQALDDSYEHAVIKFNNGLILDLHLLMDTLQRKDGYHFIKTIQAAHSNNKFYLFEGKEEAKMLREGSNNKLIVRVVRSFEYLSDRYSQLRGLTIWVFDSNEPDKILETYQINFNKQRDDSWVKLLGQIGPSQAFDISDHCYLNNEHMKNGKDYAWVHLKYYADPLVLRYVQANEEDVKDKFYMGMLKLIGNDPVRLPKLEMSYQDDAFIFRALVLDVAPYEHSYEPVVGSLGDLAESQDLAPNLESCARLCRLHKCTALTYCSQTNTCLNTIKTFDMKQLKNEPVCNTYVAPSHWVPVSSLQNLLAKLQHTNYAEQLEGMPELPDELDDPYASADDQQLNRIRINYYSKVSAYLQNSSVQLPELAMYLGPHRLAMPAEFYAESDPLSDFDLLDEKRAETGDSDPFESEEKQAAAFHVGEKLAQLRLVGETASKDDGQSHYTRYLTSVSHDQCASICRDARCGLFSYCPKLQECIVSSVYSIGEAKKYDLIKPSIECYIMERDYLANFQEFPMVPTPANYVSKLESAGSASECALKCVNETSYNCLSFQHCIKQENRQQKNFCYFQESHTLDIVTNQMGILRKYGFKDRTKMDKSDESNEKPLSIVLCTHYSRSYLADFKRFDYRAIEETKLEENFETSTHHGLNVFECAKKCYVESNDCTAFQNCKNLPKLDSDIVEQKCQLILGRRNLNETSDQVPSDGHGDKPADASKLLVYSEECQLFALRRDSVKAHLHHLMLSSLVSKDGDETSGGRNIQSAAQTSSGASTLFALMLMFTVVTITSAALVYVFIRLRDSPEVRVRGLIERARDHLHL